jgi:hypothetical protein
VALTLPKFDAPSVQCNLVLQSVDTGMVIYFALTPTQVEAFTDQQLVDKVEALKAAMVGFLLPGNDIQVRVTWGTSANATLIETSEVVPRPA